MTMRKKLRYEQLPPQLAAIVLPADFIKGYDCVDSGSVIVWFVNRKTGKQQEVEFSLKEQRILLREERERDFPAPEEVTIADQGFRVVKGNCLELGTDVRYETYDVYLDGTPSKFLTCEQIYFAPVLLDVGDVVRSAAKNASFSTVYGGWPLVDRVNYWVVTLYRLRHRAGEDGALEDEVFSSGLVDKMRSIDSGIDAILPAVLNGLAAMESVNFQGLIQSFNKRTGLSILPKDF